MDRVPDTYFDCPCDLTFGYLFVSPFGPNVLVSSKAVLTTPACTKTIKGLTIVAVKLPVLYKAEHDAELIRTVIQQTQTQTMSHLVQQSNYTHCP